MQERQDNNPLETPVGYLKKGDVFESLWCRLERMLYLSNSNICSFRGIDMGEELFSTPKDLDFDYEDSLARIIPLTSLQEVKMSGTTIGPLEEGKEVETRFWIAEELVKAGYVRFHEDDVLTYATLNKLHWRETKLSKGLQISPLPDYFYPKLRRFINGARERASKEPIAASQYVQADRLARDIINCRLRKIVSLAASSTRASSVVRALSKEERILFKKVKIAVTDWEKKILEF